VDARRRPPIGGQAWIYGFANYVLDPTDPFTNGHTVGDLWAQHEPEVGHV